MAGLIRWFVFLAMALLSVVSMWTTYVSLHDSVFPEPAVTIPMGILGVWHCSVLALGLTVAIGMMLFALKLAIVQDQKGMTLSRITGLCIVAFISIVFNMDVLYRTADRDFFLRYSSAKMKNQYVAYLQDAHVELTRQREAHEREVAAQEGELESEISGLREAPAGYGSRARKEEYRLRLLERTTTVELSTIEDALKAQSRAEELLSLEYPTTIDEVERLQTRIRVMAKNAGAVAGLPLPEAVRLDNPLFAVFERLFDVKTVGPKELFFLAIALFLDLGDILGYSLASSRQTPDRKRADNWASAREEPTPPQRKGWPSRIGALMRRIPTFSSERARSR